MGMFDTIVIHDSLLPEEIKGIVNYRKIHDWQTKSLDNVLDYYYISEDRELLKITRNEDIRELRKYNTYPKSYITQYISDTIFVHTYTEGLEKDDFDIWVEMKIVINNGEVLSIEVADFTKTESKIRIERVEEMCRDYNRKHNMVRYVFLEKVTRVLDKVISKLSKLRYKISEYINNL